MTAARPRVVVVGAGFGGLACVQALATTPVEITLVDRRNYHLFQPLLYQVATAALSPADIAWPIRAILRGQSNVEVQLGRVTGVDRKRRMVLLEDGRMLPFDMLVIATGARHAYFGHDEWEAVAPGLKKIDDATLIRQRVLLAFERAEASDDPAERRALLTFVVVGGGPTGVEMAGALAELARHALAKDFRRIDPRSARVVLVEAGPALLATMPASLQERTRTTLTGLGVEVRLGAPVTACDERGVVVAGERIAAANVVWAAGVIASPAASWLGVAQDRAGRTIVGPDLALADDPRIFVIGDTAAVPAPLGPVPGNAPAAKQMGRHVAAAIRALVTTGCKPPGPFRWRNPGSLATIGRGAAVVDLGRLRFSGFPAWLFWAVAHVWFLIGWKNRLSVGATWAWSYLTYDRGARLITGASSEALGRTRDPVMLPVDRVEGAPHEPAPAARRVA